MLHCPRMLRACVSLKSIYDMVHGLCLPLLLIPQQVECRSGVPVSQTQEVYVFLVMQMSYDNTWCCMHTCIQLCQLDKTRNLTT